jgi:hypothetical protein
MLRRLVLAAALGLALVGVAHAEDKPVRALFVLVGAGGHNVEVNTPPLLETIKQVGGIEMGVTGGPLRGELK